MQSKKYYLISVFALTIIFSGCAAMLVPETKNPDEKLSWAYSLILNGRPLPAEKLIKEAVEIYSKDNNLAMLGYSYHLYGILEYRFPKNDDKTKKAAIEYFKISLKYFHEHFTQKPYKNDDPSYASNYFRASSAAQHLGDSYDPKTNIDLVCQAYALSLKYNKLGMEIKPEAKINVTRDFSNFEEFIKSKQEKAKCIN
jgi:hypothetical protein